MSPSMHHSPYHSPSPLLTSRNAGNATPRALTTPRTMATPRMAWRPATAGGAPLTSRPSTAGSITHRPGSSHRRMAAPRFLDMRPRYATSGTSALIDPKDAIAVADPTSDLDKFLGSSDNIQVVVQLRDADPAALTGLPVVPPRGMAMLVSEGVPSSSSHPSRARLSGDAMSPHAVPHLKTQGRSCVPCGAVPPA